MHIQRVERQHTLDSDRNLIFIVWLSLAFLYNTMFASWICPFVSQLKSLTVFALLGLPCWRNDLERGCGRAATRRRSASQEMDPGQIPYDGVIQVSVMVHVTMRGTNRRCRKVLCVLCFRDLTLC